MKTIVLAATLIASVLAVAGSAQANPHSSFEGHKFWQEQGSRFGG